MRCHWDEDDVWFYFGIDAEGWVTRQVELQGSELTPTLFLFPALVQRLTHRPEMPLQWRCQQPLTVRTGEQIWGLLDVLPATFANFRRPTQLSVMGGTVVA